MGLPLDGHSESDRHRLSRSKFSTDFSNLSIYVPRALVIISHWPFTRYAVRSLVVIDIRAQRTLGLQRLRRLLEDEFPHFALVAACAG